MDRARNRTASQLSLARSARRRRARRPPAPREPDHRRRNRRQHGQHGAIHRLPPRGGDHRARGERRDAHRREYDEVVGALHARLLGWSVGLGQQRRAARVHEVPPDAEHDEGHDEVRDGEAVERDHRAQRDEHHSRQDDVDDPEAADQRASEESRRVHADHMPLDDDRHRCERMMAEVHRNGSRGHQQVHEAVAHCAREHRDNENRLAHDDGERPALRRALLQRRGRHVDERLHGEREQREPGKRDKAA